jgi:hypothetical protein
MTGHTLPPADLRWLGHARRKTTTFWKEMTGVQRDDVEMETGNQAATMTSAQLR